MPTGPLANAELSSRKRMSIGFSEKLLKGDTDHYRTTAAS